MIFNFNHFHFPCCSFLQDLLLFTADGIGARPFRKEVVEELQRWQAESLLAASGIFHMAETKALTKNMDETRGGS